MPEDIPQETVAIWPENWQTVEVFGALQTQWNFAPMGGVVGLRYESLPAVFDFLGVKPGARRRVFHGLRVMEAEAVRCLAEREE